MSYAEAASKGLKPSSDKAGTLKNVHQNSSESTGFQIKTMPSHELETERSQATSNDASMKKEPGDPGERYNKSPATRPLVLGNALLITLLSTGLGIGAYHKHVQGELTGRLVALWSGGIGLLGLLDYLGSRYLAGRGKGKGGKRSGEAEYVD